MKPERANHIIEALHRSLSVKWMKGALPNTLFLQVDNCTRENKNRFFFSYVEALVGWGVFEKVYVSFLPIGHTHADIDQAFSCTSRRLRNYDAVTMEELIVEIGRSYSPVPTVKRMRNIPNFSGLCKQTKILNNTRPFSQFRYFRFHRVEGTRRSRTESFRTGCSVRVGCEDQWHPLVESGEHRGFLRVVPDLSATPKTPAVSPDNIEEVNKRLLSEETRINSRKRW